jgi:hypothetical protein
MTQIFLIKKDAWGSKIHIIWPSQIDNQNNSEIDDTVPIMDRDLSKSYPHTAWCTTKVNGVIKQRPEEYMVKDISESFCTRCIESAIKSSSRTTPQFVNKIHEELQS